MVEHRYYSEHEVNMTREDKIPAAILVVLSPPYIYIS